MARILAIDYGKKRTGIAVSDPLQIIANGLTTVETKELIVFLKKYFDQEAVETVIIGLPKSLKNEATDATPLVMQFMKLFKNSFQTMIDAGLGKKARQNKALIDEISATILLQGYMTTL
jgi:putative Holliday junction resolvase